MEGFTLVKQGAEAKLHVGSFLGQRVIAKERFPKKYRHPAIDQQLTKKRFKAELKLLVRCKKLGIRTPTIYLADADKSFFIMEYLSEAVTSRDLINEARASEVEADRGRLSKVLKNIGETVAKLHNDGVIHGDLTTSNILVDGGSEDELVLIDFGLGFSEGSAEDKGALASWIASNKHGICGHRTTDNAKEKGVDLYVLERAFLSTHPNMEDHFAVLLDSYQSKLNKGDKKAVVAKYEEIRMRGRKRTMVG